MNTGNYNLIERLLKDFTDINDFVQSFELSFDDQRSKWNENEKLFPTIYAVVRNIQNTEYTINWNIDVYILDNLNQDRSNEKSIMNTTGEIGNQFINFIRDYYNEFTTFTVDPTLQPLNNFDNNRMNGWRANMTIETRREQCYIGSDSVPFYPLPGEQLIIKYLTCDTLGDCNVFTTAIDNLQNQINSLDPDNFFTIDSYLDGNIIRFDRNDQTNAYFVDLTSILFDGQYSSLTGTPTNLSDFNNDENFINCTTLENCSVITTIQNDITNVENDLNNYLPLTGGTITGSLNVVVETITIELIDALNVVFYNDYAISIESITNIVNSPNITILVDSLAYTLGVTIPIGSKIDIITDTQCVINLITNRQ